MTDSMDWGAWHTPYSDPQSSLSRRLAVVQGHIRSWLDSTSGPVNVLSVCSGDARDLIAVLEGRSDADRVTATLVELDPMLCAHAKRSAEVAGLTGVTVRTTDAGASDAYVGAVPADLVLLCGVLGNISDADMRRVVAVVPQLCRPDARVVWTRHTRAPDLTPAIRGWFAQAGCQEEAFTAPDDVVFSVGLHRFTGEPHPLDSGARLFRFIR